MLPRPDSRRYFLKTLALAGLARGVVPRALSANVPTVDEELRRAAKSPGLRMLFKGSTPAALSAWQQQFSTEIRRRIGPHDPPARWNTQLLSRTELPDHVRESWLLTADGVASLPLHVLLPDPARHGAGPFPLIVALHGHGPFGHDAVAGIDDTPERRQNITELNYDYGRQLVREGYVIVAPCLTPFGARLDASYARARADPCATTFVRLTLLGQTLIGANLRDCRWAISYGQSRPEVRTGGVGCVGLSLGGRMTMMTAALDPRVHVAAISGALNVMQERVQGQYAAGCQAIPGLLELGDTPEIGSLIAPRPCVWETGTKDALIKPEWAEIAKTRLRSAYAAAGTAEQLQFHQFEGGHSWGKTAVPMLGKILKGP
jgi:dienelactone hydrolase